MLDISWDRLFSQTQLPFKYNSVIDRHGQWFRWLRGITCPCITTETAQPNINCTLCKGEGRIYKNPLNMLIYNESAKHDGTGRVYTKFKPISKAISVFHKSTELSIATIQPNLSAYIQLNPPYPKRFEALFVNYEFTPLVSITNENSIVIGTNTLQVTSSQFIDKGKVITGSLNSVTKVKNVTKNKTYTVSSFAKNLIYLTDMESWISGDVLEVDYVYMQPVLGMMYHVSPKMRYDKAFVLEESDAILVVYSYMKVGPNDLFTALAENPLGTMIINPKLKPGNDIISRQFDISNIIDIIDKNGVVYDVSTSVELYGRNEIKWKVTKPTVNYTVQFTYHPTYIALRTEPTIRNAENRDYANRINMMLYEKFSNRVF